MQPRRPRRPTEIRLDRMDEASAKVREGLDPATPCPRCQTNMVATENEAEGGVTIVLRCEACGYVYLKRR